MYLTVLIIDMLLSKGGVKHFTNTQHKIFAKCQNINLKAFLSVNQLIQCDS